MSVRLKDRTRQIPNGFRFLQPETGFEPQPWSSFDSICHQVITHRQGNIWLAQKHSWLMTLDAIAKEVDQYNAKICESHGWNAYIVQDNESPPVFMKASLPRPDEAPNAAVGNESRVSKVVAGVKTLADWLGSGLMPVDQALADKRAKICVQCPQNRVGNFWQQLESAAAAEIKSLIEIKSDMQLKTNWDDKLKSCLICTCWNPLKIFTPLDHVLANTSPETMAAFPEKCWVKRLDK